MVTAVIFVFENSFQTQPCGLQLLEGISSLDLLLETLRTSQSIDKVVVVCKTVTYTRWLQNFGSTRHIEEGCFICLDNLQHLVAFSKLQTQPLILLNSNTFLSEGSTIIDALSNDTESLIYTQNGSVPVLMSLNAEHSMQFVSLLSDTNLVQAANNDDALWYVHSKLSAATSMRQVPSLSAYDLGDADQRASAAQLVRAQIASQVASLPNTVEESCFARVGLMGNPSDGFEGKTVSFLIQNFRATVTLEPTSAERGIEIVEPLAFGGLDELQLHSTVIVSKLM